MIYNNTSVIETSSTKDDQSKFLTLCGCWILIVIGNSLVIGVHRVYRRKHIPDYLILVLAIIDLINAFVPVLFSLIMYKINPHGFLGLQNNVPCYFYNSAATFLRLSACFVMTMMAFDRALSVEKPLYYRTSLQLKTIKRWTKAVISIAVLVAFVPLTGVTTVIPYQAVCSFDFGSGYAVFIASIGYLQLVIVLICYIVVVKGLLSFAGEYITYFSSRLNRKSYSSIPQCQRVVSPW